MDVETANEAGQQQHIGWAIHIFTSLGIMAGFFAVVSVLDRSPRAALLWLMTAMIIDGLDGPIARRYDVPNLIPKVDGNALDLMIDYVCCVVAPALFIYEFHLLPRMYHLSLVGVFLILTSSLYVMSNKGIMTEDRYFNGFPSMWNLVANVLFVLQSRQWINVGVIAVLVVCSFVPIKFIHPIRVRDFRRITIPVLVVWLGAMIYVTWVLDERTRACSEHCLSTGIQVSQGLVYLGTIWILGVGIARTIHGPFHHDVQGQNSLATS
jgi:phosphatidylcholine synthase